MKKVLLWIVGIAVAIFLLLLGVGYHVQHKAISFVQQAVPEANIAVVSDYILCSQSQGIGIVVMTGNTKKDKVYPVCAPLFGEVSLGKFREAK